MTSLAKRVEQIKPSFTLEMVSRAADLKSKGIDLINFSAGQPDFNTPNNICLLYTSPSPRDRG